MRGRAATDAIGLFAAGCLAMACCSPEGCRSQCAPEVGFTQLHHPSKVGGWSTTEAWGACCWFGNGSQSA
eukprot:3626383-Alexandrium_andersonii.AAC.1